MMRLLTEFFPRVRSPFSRQYFSGRGWPLRWTFVNPSLTSLLGHFTNSFTVSTSSFLYEQSSIVLSTSELRVYNSVLPTKLLSCWGNETIPISTSHPFCHFTILIQRLSWALKNVAKRIPQCPSDATILVVKRRRKPQCCAVLVARKYNIALAAWPWHGGDTALWAKNYYCLNSAFYIVILHIACHQRTLANIQYWTSKMPVAT